MLQQIKNFFYSKFNAKYFNYIYGIYGEFFAILILTFKGYILLKRRYRNKISEIDLIFYKQNTIIFVEVKSRKNIKDCYSIVKNNQVKNIKKSAEIFIRDNKKLKNCYSRFDIFILDGFFKFNHIINSF